MFLFDLLFILVKTTRLLERSIVANVSICVRAGLPKPRAVPDSERNKDTKTLDYASTPLDANTLLCVVLSSRLFLVNQFVRSQLFNFAASQIVKRQA
jgi:hypothetical protein